MSKGKILVTGGTGYIGSHTVTQLLINDWEVISVDNLSNSFEDVNDRIFEITNKKPIFIKADLCDKIAVDTIFQKHKNIKAVIHFAAYKSVGESVDFPLKYYNNNINSLLNIIEISNKNSVYNIVFSSSCTVYGQPKQLPVNENADIKKPFSPYGNTKIICEEILKDYSICNKSLKTIALRYFNPIGAHSSGIIGELPIGVPNNLMPYITQTAIGIRDKLNIFGGDYNTSDGTAIRDYIHVVDLADAHISALERLLNNEMNNQIEFFNIGTGNGYSVLQIVNSFIKNNNIEIKYKIVDRRSGDIEKIWADPSLANNVLGWKAKYSLDDMVKTAWEWEKYYRNNLNKK